VTERFRPRADAWWLTATLGAAVGLAWRDLAALGSPPVPGALLLAGAVTLCARAVPDGTWSRRAGLAGVFVLPVPELLAAVLDRAAGPADAARAWPGVAALAVALAVAPAARAARGGATQAFAIGAGLAVGTQAPRALAVVVAVLGVAIAARALPPRPPATPYPAAARFRGAAGALVATLGACAALTGGTGVAHGAAVPGAATLAVLAAGGAPERGRALPTAVVLAGLAGAAGAWAAEVPWGVVLAGGVLLGAGTGLAGTPWVAATVCALAAWAGPAALRALPVDRQARLAEARPSDPADAAWLAEARRDTRVVHADAGGAGIVVRADAADRPLYELGGALLDPRTRLARAEGWAATVAACTAPGRTHARVAGDPTGRATATLRTHGFTTVDLAVPDAGLARAVRALQPSAERTLLAAGVRLVRAPDAWVARVGPAADAVVEITRTPHDAASDAAGLRATRRSLAVGGVHARLVPLGRTPPESAVTALRAFAAAYPDATAWMTPEGLDALVLLGSRDGAPTGWEALQRCVRADPDSLRTLGITDATDVAGLLLADRAALAAAPTPARAVDLVDALGARPLDLAARLGPEAPRAVLEARRETRRAWIGLLERAEAGAPPEEVFTRGAALRARPGGEAALAPLVRPHLQRARDALARARREGPASPAWAEIDSALATARMVTPDAADVRCLEGELAEARAQPDRARDAYTRCVAADPARGSGWDGLARVERTRGDAPAVEAALRGALAAAAGRWTSHHNLGVFLLESGRTDEAEPLLSQAAALSGRATPVPPEPLLALARLHLATDRPALALAESERALALAPEHAHALALRGAARYELGQLDLAEEAFRAALARDPRDLLARGGLGQVHASRGEADLAAAAFREVLARDPRNAPARENLRRLGPMLRDAGGPRQGGRTP
jgi:tetratricopeptide (TPR) repeat protein